MTPERTLSLAGAGLGIAGFALLCFVDLRAALGVFLMITGNNMERRLRL